MRIALLIVLLCSTAAAEAPAVRARQFVDAQLAALTRGDDAALIATFAPDTVMLGSYDAATPVEKLPHGNFQGALLSGSPHASFKKVVLKSLVAGGDDHVVWLTAELEATYDSHEPESGPPKRGLKQVTRLTELIVPDGTGWRAVAVVFDRPGKLSGYVNPSTGSIANATQPGTFAPMLASPSSLMATFSKARGTFVIGTDRNERALGAGAAKKLLRSWTKLGLELDGDVREVSTKTYAFAQAHVLYRKQRNKKLLTYRMAALIIAVPAGNGWSVVGVHYAAD